MTYSNADGIKFWEKMAQSNPYGAITAETASDRESFLNQGKSIVRQFSEELQAFSNKPLAQCMLIDYGCGAGRLTVHWSAVCRMVIGIDASATMIKLAQEIAAAENVVYLLNDGESLPLPDNSADLFCTSIVFHHMPFAAVKAVIADARRVLRPGGLLAFQQGVFSDPSRRVEAAIPSDVFLRTIDELKEWLTDYNPLHLAVDDYWRLHIARVRK